jgi:hypothetical protein
MKRFGKHQVPTRLYQLIQKLIENHSSLDKDSKLTTENLASLYLNQLWFGLKRYLDENIQIQIQGKPVDIAFVDGFPHTIEDVVGLAKDAQERFNLASCKNFKNFMTMHNYTGKGISETSLILWYVAAFKVTFVDRKAFSSFDDFWKEIWELKLELKTKLKLYAQQPNQPRKRNKLPLFLKDFGREYLQKIAKVIQKPIEMFGDIVLPNDILNLEKIQGVQDEVDRDQDEVARKKIQEDVTKRLREPGSYPDFIRALFSQTLEKDLLQNVSSPRNVCPIYISEEDEINTKGPASLVGDKTFWPNNYGESGYFVKCNGKWFSIEERLSLPVMYYDRVLEFLKNATVVYIDCGCVLCGAQATGKYKGMTHLCVPCIYAIKTGKVSKPTTRMTAVSRWNSMLTYPYEYNLNYTENYVKLHETVVGASDSSDFFGDFNPPTTYVSSHDTCSICGQSTDDGRGGNKTHRIHTSCAMKELGSGFEDIPEIAIKILSEGFSVVPNAEKLATSEVHAFEFTQESRANGCPISCETCGCSHADETSDHATFHFQNSLYIAVPALGVILDAYTMVSVPVDSELYPKLCEQFWKVVEEFRQVSQ